MSATLLSFLRGIPELGERVYLDVAPKTPDTPYAIRINPLPDVIYS